MTIPTIIINVKAKNSMKFKFDVSGKRSDKYKSRHEVMHEDPLLEGILSKAPHEPIEGPITLNISIYLKIQRNISKNNRALMLRGKIVPTKRPDISKVMDNILHIMETQFFINRGQIVNISIIKKYDIEDRIEVNINQWQQSSSLGLTK